MTTPDFPHGMDTQKNREHPDGDSPLGIGFEDGLDDDELALRRLLHDVVQDLEPRPETLNHLRRAVPARRARRRQLLVGAAAACLLAVAAVPAALHVANTADSQNPNPANASSSRDTDTGDKTGGHDSDKPAGSVSNGKKGSGKGGKSASKPSTGATGKPDTSGTLAATAPACTSADLGNVASSAAGYFQLGNVSTGPCTVEGGGSVTFSAQGGADASRISVVDHTAGDGTSLPDSTGEPLILQQGQSFQVRFAWVAAAGGGTSGCESVSSPSPSPTTSADDTSSGTTSGDGGTTTSLDSAADESGTASIVLTYTPAAGGPAVSVTLPDACAGTVYRTGVVAAS